MNDSMNNVYMLNNQINQNNIISMNNNISNKSNINEENEDKNDDILEDIDVYPHIIEDKKFIFFVRNNSKNVIVRIPYSLRKNELYSTAEEFKIDKYSTIKLFYNNVLLSNDESTINDKLEADKVSIIEEYSGVDENYIKNIS
jgi:hypothetical protein